ncbi:MAG: prolyl oligopeptidase family serine peptidase [Chloroflexaceae bacterium]|nr:prolyl oligopeptidase family serine peptidase [Chloroflexaceae bacterium]
MPRRIGTTMITLLVLLGLTLGGAVLPSVQAQGTRTLVYLPLIRSTAPEGGRDPITISADSPPADILTPAEVARIRTLQETVAYRLLSPVSPDGISVLLAGANVAVLNIDTGATVAVGADFGNYTCSSNLVWRDTETLACLATATADNATVLLTLRRSDGSVQANPVSVPGTVRSLSPDGRLALVQVAPPGAALAGTSLIVRPGLPVPVASNAPANEIEVANTSTTLAVIDLATQQRTDLLTLESGALLTSAAAWSPDSRRVAFTHTTYDRVDSAPPYTDPANGTLLDSVAAQDVLGLLPPANNPLLQTNMLRVFAISGTTALSQTLRAAQGNGDTFGGEWWEPEPEGALAWSPDGTRLAVHLREPAQVAGRTHPIYTYPSRGYFNVYTIAPDLSTAPQLAATVRAPQIEAQWVSNVTFVLTDTLMFNSTYRFDRGIYTYDLNTQRFQQISPRTGTYTSVRPAGVRGQLVTAFSSYSFAPEVYRLSVDGTGFTALTDSNAAAQAANQVRVDQVEFTLGNGLTHTGVIIQPADAPFPPQNTRLIVWQERGPSQDVPMTNYWSAQLEQSFNLLPNFGYAMLIVPLYGREGYGVANFNRLVELDNFGQADIDAMAEIVQQSIARGYTSPERVGILGCSYGGYFTTQSIARHPDLYRAAHTNCTLLDLIGEWKFGFVYVMAYLMGRDPYTNSAEFIKDAPAYGVGNVRTPLLIFHGTQDFLPIKITENYFALVQQQGTPSRMLRFAGEGHGVFTPTNQRYGAQEQIQWFRTYLGTP